MSPAIRAFLDDLDTYTEAVPIDVLTEKIRALEISLDDVRSYLKFGERTYRRNLMHEGPGYHALILCWRSGQRSPIHDHRGSACGVRVLTGVCTETKFDRTVDGHLLPTTTTQMRAGEVCGSFDADIHQISNLEPAGTDLVTLHVYAPPLHDMGTYSLTDTTVSAFVDPVHEFCEGAGI